MVTYLTQFIDFTEAYKQPHKAVAVILFNQGKVLGVSRKYDITLMGLPGGKLDEGESFESAAIRETLEETGLEIFFLIPIFGRLETDNFYSVTYIAQWKGEIHTTEVGRVDWIDFEELKRGAFPTYNAALETHLKGLNLL